MAPAGTLTQATPKALQAAVGSRLAPHLWLARELAPLLVDAPASSYTLVTGALGEVGGPAAAQLGQGHLWAGRSWLSQD